MEYMTYEEYLVNVKKGIVTDLGHCPVTPLLLMLQGKWKAQILYELCIHDTARFGLLKRMLKVITMHPLRRLSASWNLTGSSKGNNSMKSRPM